MRALGIFAAASSLLLAAGCLSLGTEVEREADVRATVLDEFTRPHDPVGLSGIANVRDNDLYVAVDDRGGLLHQLYVVLTDEGKVSSCTLRKSVALAGRVDLEGCAYDPLDRTVWVSDERDSSIREYDYETGEERASVAVPEVFRRNVRDNCSFEALAISPDGHAMYVANEDTLTCDGKPSNNERGGEVRIQEFVRRDAGSTWVATRQFRYRTDPVEGEKFRDISISGAAAMCIDDEGRLYLLEREFSKKNPVFPTFRARLYQVDLDEDSHTAKKRLVWGGVTGFANYEGMCFGTDLKDGTKVLVLVSDGGQGAERTLLTLAIE